MAAPILSNVGERVFDDLTPVVGQDTDQDDALAKFVHALAAPLEEVDELVSPTDDGTPGWVTVSDADTTPAKFLTWLGQFVGVKPVEGLTVLEQRARVNAAAGFFRGSVQAIIDAPKPYLTGTQTVTLYERTPTAYSYVVITYDAETAAAATVGLLEDTYSGRTIADLEAEQGSVGQLETNLSPDAQAVYDALMEQKPGGLVFEHRVDDGWSVGQVEAAYAGRTIADLTGDYATIGGLETVIPNG